MDLKQLISITPKRNINETAASLSVLHPIKMLSPVVTKCLPNYCSVPPVDDGNTIQDYSTSDSPTPYERRTEAIKQLPTLILLPKMNTPVIDDATSTSSDSSIESTPLEDLKLSSGSELSTPESPKEYVALTNPRTAVYSREVFHKRPSFGTIGRNVRLLVNYFEMKIPRGSIYHYNVDITPLKKGDSANTSKKYRCLSTRVNREVMNKLLEANSFFQDRCPAYDGRKNLFTANPLDLEDPKKFTILVNDEEVPTEYSVVIKPVSKGNEKLPAISLEPLHQVFQHRSNYISEAAILALDTILRHGPAMKLTPIGRSFFSKPLFEESASLGGGREIWFGYHQSVRLSQWKPVLNIDMSATAFYQSGPLLTFIEEILHVELERVKELTDAQTRLLTKELKGLKVHSLHLPYKRKYKINNITREPAYSLYFCTEGSYRISVAEYFCQKYGALRYPNLPCVCTGNPSKPIHLPIEVCELCPGQHCNKKLDDKQVADMMKQTARPPLVRFRDIMNSAKETISISEPLCNDFGITISQKMVRLDGRVLPPPSVMYHQKQEIQPSNGVWDMRGKCFYNGVKIEKWALISLNAPLCREVELKSFARMLHEGGTKLGIAISEVSHIRGYSASDGTVEHIIKKVVKRCSSIQLLVIVLPSKGSSNIYSEVKDIAEIKLGLITQCIKDVNVTGKKCNQQLICNICQKINTKLGGVNISLSPIIKPAVLKRPVIIIGADCSHPSPEDKIKYSVSALVGSLDNYPSRYAASVSVQLKGRKKGAEIIQNMNTMVQELLLAFFRHTKGKKPEKIIIYRDGLSEGEYRQALVTEMSLVRKACSDMNRSEVYQPPITFIVVGKRHHTRFITERPEDGVGKHSNIPPGTIVDSDVTHPIHFDFYLCSHATVQGTSRPAHYNVLWDDNNFTTDDLQTLSYYLCHTYARCTRSISVPCPVMYAHLAAYRAKQHLIARYEEMTSSSSDSASSDISLDQTQYSSMERSIRIDNKLKNSMYFV